MYSTIEITVDWRDIHEKVRHRLDYWESKTEDNKPQAMGEEDLEWTARTGRRGAPYLNNAFGRLFLDVEHEPFATRWTLKCLSGQTERFRKLLQEIANSFSEEFVLSEWLYCYDSARLERVDPSFFLKAINSQKGCGLAPVSRTPHPF